MATFAFTRTQQSGDFDGSDPAVGPWLWQYLADILAAFNDITLTDLAAGLVITAAAHGDHSAVVTPMHSATSTLYTDTGTRAGASTVQAAILAIAVTLNMASGVAALPGTRVALADAGSHFTTDTAEAALQDLGSVGIHKAYVNIPVGAAFPVTVAHGQAYIPHVTARFRAYDSGGAVWSKYMQFGESDFYSDVPGTNSYWMFSNIHADATNIYFHIKQSDNVAVASYSEFSVGSKTKFWFPKDSDNSMSNIWDTIEIDYRIEK